ncbi:MAG: hypothetical protein ABI247_10745 [Rhodanobacter sp.]
MFRIFARIALAGCLLFTAGRLLVGFVWAVPNVPAFSDGFNQAMDFWLISAAIMVSVVFLAWSAWGLVFKPKR